MKLSLPLVFCLFGALGMSLREARSAETRSFYAGKTVTIFVGEPAGGGSDAYARLLSRHLGRHIPGNPGIVVQNLPGAGTLKAVMYINNTAPADGTAMATFSSALLTQALIAPQRIGVDFRRYSWIGNISEDVRICYVWGASGVKTMGEMQNLSKEIFMGATAPGTAGNADTAMLKSLFGVKLRQVQGYGGSADKRLAIERREIDGECGGWTALPEEWLTQKKINIVVRLSPTLVAGMDPNVPFGGDLVKNAADRRVYDFITAPERLGRIFMVSPKVAGERVGILRSGFAATMKDQAFLAEAARARFLVTPMSGDDVVARIAELYTTPPDLIARAKAILGE